MCVCLSVCRPLTTRRAFSNSPTNRNSERPLAGLAVVNVDGAVVSASQDFAVVVGEVDGEAGEALALRPHVQRRLSLRLPVDVADVHRRRPGRVDEIQACGGAEVG